ncbi:hypothetical protein DLJ53_06385 [Acuticoccus sediminis]|uniref:NAD-dependent epimerase/dehydratase domain-containing protein n=1 Tax=Acuticoccus sediminis TaxID=2184697 RepID=A0A8B2NV84_9HYPH|nr:NAD-dependent epimerase/dehydratase family protein [Acuticoccus sediminis]RAI04077.1 hypothetical protein DLJ53_06385 [Acuticoccus sediminis]
MARILITGAAGFLGRTVVEALVRHGELDGPAGYEPVTTVTLVDRVPSSPPDTPFEVRVTVASLTDTDLAPLVAEADVIIHLAASLTIASERDVPAGYDLNLQVPIRILEAARLSGRNPRVIFPSSIAVFGGTLPDRVSEATVTTPQTSYGTAKAMVELMLSDYARHGYADGRAIRIPIVVTRPGLPHPVVSDIVSEVIRGPIVGRKVVSPLDPDMPFPLVTVERVAQNIIALAERPTASFGASRALHQPGLKTTPREMVDSLRRIVGEKAASRVSFQPDLAVTRVVASWPSDFTSDVDQPLAGDEDVDGIVHAAVARFS